ncbi:MAG: glycosyltransferase [Elusimicrobia bacterium]|nr:glycosyltransferase [Elusimicrobiota bacterium]
MIINENIICFGFAEWDNPYKTNQHHLMSRLSANNRILFIESLGLRRPTFQKKDIFRIFKRVIKWLKGIRTSKPNLFVFAPLVLPFHRYRFIRNFNNWFLGKQLDIVIAKLKLNNPIIWTYIPNAVEYLARWKEKLCIYHCVDDISANPLVPKEAFHELEEMLLKKVNIVFASSKPLFEQKIKFNKNTYYLPNVADFDHFNKADSKDIPLAEELEKIPSPRLGFMGAISEYKLDFELLAFLAEKHPEWSIILIGDTGEGEKKADLSSLIKNKNIYFLSGKQYNQLPMYLKGFDICLLPNKINQYTKNMFPMKFFEYLSSGKPIISTNLDSLNEFKELFYLSDGKEEFEENVLKALKENSEELKNKRIELAKQYTWEKRIEQMSEIIEAELKKQN